MILQTINQHLRQKFPQLQKWNTPHNNTLLCYIDPYYQTHYLHDITQTTYGYIQIILTDTTIIIKTRITTPATKQNAPTQHWTTTTHTLTDPNSIEQIEKRINEYLVTARKFAQS